jgi:hypothetical protein
MRPEPGRYGFAGEIRAHYHNMRLRLLEQMIGARMLALSSDLGDETERIWQQFLEQHLGPMFRVLRGGYICDHAGNKSCQVEMIVSPRTRTFSCLAIRKEAKRMYSSIK